jgi:hypothetical protein
MNWGTLVQQITEDLHYNVRDTDVKRMICDAIKRMQQYRLPHAQGTFNVPVPINADSIKPGAGLPSDVREIFGNELYISQPSVDGDEETDEAIVTQVSRQEMERMLIHSGDYDTGTPVFWNWYNDELRFSPRADIEGYVLRGNYVRQLGIPRYEYASSAWVFYTPEGDTMFDAYTSAWFDNDKLSPLIVFYAKYLCYMAILKVPEKANMELQAFSEMLTSISTELENKEGGRRRVPWPGI